MVTKYHFHIERFLVACWRPASHRNQFSDGLIHWWHPNHQNIGNPQIVFNQILCCDFFIMLWKEFWGAFKISIKIWSNLLYFSIKQKRKINLKNCYKKYSINSSEKIMQIPMKDNKIFFCDIKHGLIITSYF